MDWLEQHFTVENSLSRPNWEPIYRHAESELSNEDQDKLWTEIMRCWVNKLCQDLSDGYYVKETDNFALLTNANTRYADSLSGFLERCLKRLNHILKGIASDEGFGKYVVMVFDNNDRYYDYISYYGPQEGTYGLSSGMYLNYGYGHFVFPHQELDFSEPIVAHEMTHAVLSHLPIPLWLNEGMAVNMEAMITGFNPPHLDKEMFTKHQSFWSEKEIQEFWYGSSFGRPDEGQQLSYQLAQILVTNLSEQYEAFAKFSNLAHWQDGGEAAIRDIFSISLGDMIGNFLGPGNWAPDPESWEKET